MQVHQLAAGRIPSQYVKRSGPVETITVRRDVWREAVKAANGDVRRIRIISARRVEITDR